MDDIDETKLTLIELVDWLSVEYDKQGPRHLELRRMIDAASSLEELVRVDELIDEWVENETV